MKIVKSEGAWRCLGHITKKIWSRDEPGKRKYGFYFHLQNKEEERYSLHE